MKIIVTGATGFIGGSLVRRLMDKGHAVVCLVRETSNTEKLRDLGVKFVYADITDDASINKVIENEKPDHVFHCAGAAGRKSPDMKWEHFHEANVVGTRNICKACRENDVDRVIYLSSAAVVLDNREEELAEDMVYASSSAYGLSKIEAEKVVLEYRRKGLKVAIIRPFLVYGEGEPHSFDGIFRLLCKGVVPIPGPPFGNSKLHLAYVGNVVQALELAMYSENALEGSFFIADREPINVKKFMEIIMDELGVACSHTIPGWIVRLGYYLPGIRKRFDLVFNNKTCDLTRSAGLLGYDPEVTTEEGLRRAVRNWQERKVRDDVG